MLILAGLVSSTPGICSQGSDPVTFFFHICCHIWSTASAANCGWASFTMSLLTVGTAVTGAHGIAGLTYRCKAAAPPSVLSCTHCFQALALLALSFAVTALAHLSASACQYARKSRGWLEVPQVFSKPAIKAMLALQGMSSPCFASYRGVSIWVQSKVLQMVLTLSVFCCLIFFRPSLPSCVPFGSPSLTSSVSLPQPSGVSFGKISA